MSYRSHTTWICDQCNKERDADGFPIDWIDVTTGECYSTEDTDKDVPYEKVDFCSWGCLARYAFRKSEEG